MWSRVLYALSIIYLDASLVFPKALITQFFYGSDILHANLTLYWWDNDKRFHSQVVKWYEKFVDDSYQQIEYTRHAIWCWKRNRADNIAQSKPSCLAIQILFFAPQYDEELTQTVSSSFIKFIIFLLPYEMKIIIPYIFLTALTLCRMEFKKTVKDT